MSESVVSHFFSSFGVFFFFFPPVFCFIIGAPLRSGWRCDRQVRAEEKQKKKLKPARIKKKKKKKTGGDFFPSTSPGGFEKFLCEAAGGVG